MIWLWASTALAGGGPAHVMVLYNAADADGVALAEAYASARDLPEGHLCGLDGLVPDETSISDAEYVSLVLEPFEDCLAALPQPEEIDYAVLTRGLPYRVDIDAGFSASLQAMLQVMRAVDADGTLLVGQGQAPYSSYYMASVDNPVYVGGQARSGDYEVENAYSASYGTATRVVRTRKQPEAFTRVAVEAGSDWDFSDNLLVVSRLDGFDYDAALALVERGAAADGAFPEAPFLCMAAADSARGARDPECEYVTRKIEGLGYEGLWLEEHDASLSGYEVSAFFTGTTSLQDAIPGQTYAAGALGGNLTSFGAVPQNFFCDEAGESCPESESQTAIARFVDAGVTGVHGTVAEPLNNCFPGAGLLLHYAMGYSLGESYLFHQRYLYWQNIVLGDPLAAPFASRPEVTVDDALFEGAPLTVTATHDNGIEEVRLYVDGVRVDSAQGDVLETVLDAVEGEVVTLLAVAVAKKETRDVTDWDQEDIVVQAAVQGWTTVTLTVGAPLVDTGDTGDTAVALDTDTDADGSGCSSAPAPAWLGMLLALALRRRRHPRV